MMKRFLLCFAVVLSLIAGIARAGELREIELRDGSVINGEVVSLNNGIYTVKSDMLGMVKVEESKVKVIRQASPPPEPVAAQNITSNETISLQHRMMSDQEIMGMIQSLQDDPAFKKLLEDPEMLKAVSAGDVAALAANSNFMKLLDNPTVKEIHRKVQ